MTQVAKGTPREIEVLQDRELLVELQATGAGCCSQRPAAVPVVYVGAGKRSPRQTFGLCRQERVNAELVVGEVERGKKG